MEVSEQLDTVTREETIEGDYVFTFRITMTRKDMSTTPAKWLYLKLADRLHELIADLESE